MRMLLLITCLLAFTGCSNFGPERAATPSFKGMELYSWKPDGKEWHFSLLEGTNRQKTADEIKASNNTVIGTAGLKEKLSRLAVGEQIIWRNTGAEPVPDDVVRQITELGKKLEIRIWEPGS